MSRCPRFGSIPRQCRMVQDVYNPCCEKPYCDFTPGHGSVSGTGLPGVSPNTSPIPKSMQCRLPPVLYLFVTKKTTSGDVKTRLHQQISVFLCGICSMALLTVCCMLCFQRCVCTMEWPTTRIRPGMMAVNSSVPVRTPSRECTDAIRGAHGTEYV